MEQKTFGRSQDSDVLHSDSPRVRSVKISAVSVKSLSGEADVESARVRCKWVSLVQPPGRGVSSTVLSRLRAPVGPHSRCTIIKRPPKKNRVYLRSQFCGQSNLAMPESNPWGNRHAPSKITLTWPQGVSTRNRTSNRATVFARCMTLHTPHHAIVVIFCNSHHFMPSMPYFNTFSAFFSLRISADWDWRLAFSSGWGAGPKLFKIHPKLCCATM